MAVSQDVYITQYNTLENFTTTVTLENMFGKTKGLISTIFSRQLVMWLMVYYEMTYQML